jgi:hypothetical protein
VKPVVTSDDLWIQLRERTRGLARRGIFPRETKTGNKRNGGEKKRVE